MVRGASEQCLGMFQRDAKEFFQRYVTVDETWIHYTGPQKKRKWNELYM